MASLISRLLPALLVLLAAPALSGCAAVGALRTAAAPLDTYTLSPAAFARSRGATGRHVVVDIPAATGAIDTDRILVKPSPLEVRYLAGARWIDAPPELVQALLVETLANTGAFRFVTRTTAGPFPDYTLLTEILDFQAEATGVEEAPLVARVTLSVALVREDDGVIVSARRLTATRTAAAVEAPAVVGAFDAATDEVLGQTASWVLSLFGLSAS